MAVDIGSYKRVNSRGSSSEDGLPFLPLHAKNAVPIILLHIGQPCYNRISEVFEINRQVTMIQDIYPSKLHNEYADLKMAPGDALLFFDRDGRAYVGEDNGRIRFADGSNGQGKPWENDAAAGTAGSVVYLFSIDDRRYFLDLGGEVPEIPGFESYTIREIRDRFEGNEVFAVFTAYHLWRWYADNRFCGRCGSGLLPDKSERALRCPDCGNIVYPRINPAVIVGVTRGDELLITRYNRGYAHNALVAGFTEIGETLEETVAREVMEETGVKVKNIRYYKSQPWGMAQDILVGFFCDAEGDGKITMDKNELKYAEWVKREDIVLQPNSLSLTNEMMRVFKTEGEMNP